MSEPFDNHVTPRRRAGDRPAMASSALVPMTYRTNVHDDVIDAVPMRVARHDPSFLTHLIAMAERCPQTRVLRRAAPEEAMAAYRAVDAKGHALPAGITTRQNI